MDHAPYAELWGRRKLRQVSVLTQPVNFIRNLKQREVKNLRIEGISCSTRWVVSPAGNGRCGYLYRPCPTGGWDGAYIFAFPI